jgi:hypothetical protein
MRISFEESRNQALSLTIQHVSKDQHPFNNWQLLNLNGLHFLRRLRGKRPSYYRCGGENTGRGKEQSAAITLDPAEMRSAESERGQIPPLDRVSEGRFGFRTVPFTSTGVVFWIAPI